jgi:hypothetical protein
MWTYGIEPRSAEERQSLRTYRRLRRHGTTFEVLFSVVEHGCRDRAEFVARLRDALYQDFKYRSVPREQRAEFVDWVEESNWTLRAVAAFCAERTPDPRSPFIRNSLVHSIVTFNVDTILREFTQWKYQKILLRSVDRASEKPNRDRTNLYYMHGSLRFDDKARNPAKESADLVFTEQDYYDAFGRPFTVFNYSFLYLLREHPCVFLGLSMQDHNLRRLLHYSKRERVEALRGQRTPSAAIQAMVRRHYAFVTSTGDSDADDGLRRSLEPLGVTAIPVRKEEIPERLGELYRSAARSTSVGDPWAAVYGSARSTSQTFRSPP